VGRFRLTCFRIRFIAFRFSIAISADNRGRDLAQEAQLLVAASIRLNRSIASAFALTHSELVLDTMIIDETDVSEPTFDACAVLPPFSVWLITARSTV